MNTTKDTPYRLQEFCDIRNRLFDIKMQMIDVPILSEAKSYMGAKAWNKEYGLLRLNFGRQTGNSFWACHKCKELYRDGYSILMGTMNYHTDKRMKELYFMPRVIRKIEDDKQDDRLAFFTYTANKDNIANVLYRTYDFVFLDMSDFLPNRQFEMIMDRCIAKMIVMT